MMQRDAYDELNKWELYKAYGHFNLAFEDLVACFRSFIVELVKVYYGFNVDWEDAETTHELEGHLQDRLIKIILSDSGASDILEKWRACIKDMSNQDVQKVLIENDVEPLAFSKNQIMLVDLVYKKSLELIRLRNVIIHSHYYGVNLDFHPSDKLQGVKGIKRSGGFQEKRFRLKSKNFGDYIESIERLYIVVNEFQNNILSRNEDWFPDKSEFEAIEKIEFTINEQENDS